MKAKKIKKIESFKISQIDENEFKVIKAGEDQHAMPSCGTSCPVPLPYPDPNGVLHGIVSCEFRSHVSFCRFGLTVKAAGHF